jgi:hypothetical protein
MLTSDQFLELRRLWLRYVILAHLLLLGGYIFVCWKFPDPQGVEHHRVASAVAGLFFLFWPFLPISLLITFPKKKSLLYAGWGVIALEFVLSLFAPAQG